MHEGAARSSRYTSLTRICAELIDYRSACCVHPEQNSNREVQKDA